MSHAGAGAPAAVPPFAMQWPSMHTAEGPIAQSAGTLHSDFALAPASGVDELHAATAPRASAVAAEPAVRPRNVEIQFGWNPDRKWITCDKYPVGRERRLGTSRRHPTFSAGGVDVDAEFAINRKDFGFVYPGKPDDLIRNDVVFYMLRRALAASFERATQLY
jgi:hypothetical protein